MIFTTIQLINSCNDRAVHLSDKKQTDVVYLDFAKAFDSVVHKKLLTKVISYGIDGLLLSWIKAFPLFYNKL